MNTKVYSVASKPFTTKEKFLEEFNDSNQIY